MALLRCALLAGMLAVAAATEATPVSKVVDLLEGMKGEIEKEGSNEAKTYDEFACFCKRTSASKSRSVRNLNDKIIAKSASVADLTQEKKDDASNLVARKGDQESNHKELDEHNARCKKEEATFDAEIADLNKAVSSLEGAIKSMKTTGGAAAALLEVQHTVLSMRSVSLSGHKLLKAGPDREGYDYHAGDIVDLCETLLGEFKGSRDTVNSEWKKTDESCIETKASIEKELAANKKAMGDLDKSISSLTRRIAEAREALVQADGDLKDDQLYLKDLTKRCEDRANDWDQRSQQRNGELTAVTAALDVLKNEVSGRATQVNKRALLLQVKAKSPVASSLSFLQGALQSHSAKAFLARASTALDMSLEARKGRALASLQKEGRRIGSLAIAALSVRAAADPFDKVKGLIQSLIERLLAESQAEATKKGFCDERLASTRLERDNRWEEANDLSRAIAAAKAKEDELDLEIKDLTKDIRDAKKDLNDADKDRTKEKADNTNTVDTARDGLDAVTDALKILKDFYTQAAKASFLQASPVDEDTSGAGFSGSYQGKQGGMKAVFSLLEVIQTDFDRTIRMTEKAEASSHREFVEFSQTSKMDISSKSTKKELDEQDLKSTRTTLAQKMSDLQSNVDLLDEAYKELEVLKPTCIDTGMSYKERVQKREEEISALKKALCQLDPEKAEPMCT